MLKRYQKLHGKPSSCGLDAVFGLKRGMEAPKSFLWSSAGLKSHPADRLMPMPRMIKRPMKFSLTLCHSRVRRDLWAVPAALLAALAVGCAIGCASPRPPRPPSLDLPETVKDLTAARVGDVVKLRWTTPTNTTDKIAVKGAMTADICRTIVAPAAPATTCTSIKRMAVVPGPTQTSETLPASLTADPPALLAYRVQILNAHGHSAGLSPEAFAAAGAAPPPVEQLRATATRDGAMLEWRKQDASAAVELDRLPVGPNGEVIEPAPPKPASKSSPRPSPRPGGKKADIVKKPASAPAPPQFHRRSRFWLPRPRRSRSSCAPRLSLATQEEPSTPPPPAAKPSATLRSGSVPSHLKATAWSCAAPYRLQ